MVPKQIKGTTKGPAKGCKFHIVPWVLEDITFWTTVKAADKGATGRFCPGLYSVGGSKGQARGPIDILSTLDHTSKNVQ